MRKKDLIELGVTGILLAVLVFVFVKVTKKSPGLSPKPVDLSATKQAEETGNGGLYSLLEQESKTIQLRRDPFTAAPIVLKENTQSGFALTGILWDKTNPLAIIDGEVVKKGDQFGGKTVEDIKQDVVILSDGQEFIEIKLEP
ncbi:MAG: hypothetical protein PHO40_02600 [Candidatus Omnitrophica bacterium]|jgi:hypothetical protein|nr:hypothetical protein [Candidatus Omnitrophota bacterium]